MSETSQAPAGGLPFEFEALSRATRYRAALLGEFSTFLRGRVLEVGAGVGHFTERVCRLPAVRQTIAVEPDPRSCAMLRQRELPCVVIEGTVQALPAEFGCDTIVSVNVLEHIDRDEAELAIYRSLLAPALGCLCLFVPAGPEIYAPLDRDFGHYRRYTRAELDRKLRAAGFTVARLHYFNCVGYLAWWLSFRVLKQRRFNPRAVLLFDRLVLPWMHWLERTVCRPPFGQSLMAVGRVAT